MKLRTKVWFYSVSGSLLLAAVLAVFAYQFLHQFVLEQGRAQGEQAAALSQAAIIAAMQDESTRHEPLDRVLERFRHIPGMIELRLLRGPAVERQFGSGDETRQAVDATEKQMFREKRVTEEVYRKSGKTLFHYNGPIVASRFDSTSCTKCHDIAEGEILGGMSVQLDLTPMVGKANHLLGVAVFIIILSGCVVTYFLSQIMNPVLEAASELSEAVTSAEQGKFDRRIEKKGDDEIAQIAGSFNRLMDSLSSHLGKIISDIEGLTGYLPHAVKSNILEHSTEVVHSLVEAARIREGMAGDRGLSELFARINTQLQDDFGFTQFAFYTVNASKNRLEMVLAEGLSDDLPNWCDPATHIDVDNCRAKRTGRQVDGVRDPFSCRDQFCPGCNSRGRGLAHICSPILGSEGVIAILLIAFQKDDYSSVKTKLASLHYYLDVAASEIETKKLLVNLKATSLRDPLTGLHNRRYLESLQGSLTASVARRKRLMGIMMCDVDHFKQVNDIHGHDVGDLVLKEISSLLVDSTRTSDHVIRFGGEEILLLLEVDSEGELDKKAESLREAVQAKTFRAGDSTIKKTISIGMSVFPADSDNFEECLKKADLALYEAKGTGRNKVIRFQDKISN